MDRLVLNDGNGLWDDNGMFDNILAHLDQLEVKGVVNMANVVEIVSMLTSLKKSFNDSKEQSEKYIQNLLDRVKSKEGAA